MKRVLFITSDFMPTISGIANALYHYWKYLPIDKFIILAPGVKGAKEFDKLQKYKIYRYTPVLAGTSILQKVLRFFIILIYSIYITIKEKIYLVHATQPVIIGFVAKIINKIFQIPYIIYVYGGEVSKYKNTIFFNIYLNNLKKALKIITISNFTTNEISNYIPQEKIDCNYPGIDINLFKSGLNTEEFKKKYNISNKPVILTVARLVKRKGHRIVLEVLKDIIKESSEYNDLVYIIIGDGEEKENLITLAKLYNIEKNVVFTGNIDDKELPYYYNLCDIFVMLNIETNNEEIVEGFGISFIEASSCEKPVIGGISGGVKDAIEDKITGFLIDPNDKEKIKNTIKLLLKNKDMAEKIGKAGRKRVIEKFNDEVSSNKFLKYL